MSTHVAVMGATGNMGRGITKALLATGKYQVRAVTRDPDGKAAKALKEQVANVHPENLTFVKASCDDEASLVKAFAGCKYVWGMTTPDFSSEDAEYRAAIRIAKAAKATAGLETLIFNTLPNVDTLSAGKIQCVHFTDKARAFEEMKAMGLPVTGIIPGFFASNFLRPDLGGFFPMMPGPDGKLMFSTPMGGDDRLPAADGGSDVAETVMHILANPTAYKHKTLSASNSSITMNQVAKMLGVNYAQMPHDQALQILGPAFTGMFDLFSAHPNWVSVNAEAVPSSVSAKFANVEHWINQNKARILPA